MKINLVVVGSLKEKYWESACKEYLKRISRFHSVYIIEIPEEKLPRNPSIADISKSIVKEGLKIEQNMKGFNIALDVGGEEFDSIKFSKIIESSSMSFDTITFIIGGSYGLADSIKKACKLRLSFSKMTFPHQLFRVMLLEQIYRACTISNNIIYHK